VPTSKGRGTGGVWMGRKGWGGKGRGGVGKEGVGWERKELEGRRGEGGICAIGFRGMDASEIIFSVPPVPPGSLKWGTMSPHTPRLRSP